MSQPAPNTGSATGSTDAYLEIDDLRKEFGDVVAVDGIDLDFDEDELITIVGPSGCGKTTTLRMIAGLEEPTAGSIVIDGEDITHAKPKDRDLAFVFQDTAIFPHMTVRENMRFGLDHKTDLDKEEKNRRVEESAELLGIAEMLERNPTELSGGQQQRVSIGRAMVIEPAAFLLDEPFASLDANLRDRMQTEIKKLQQELETLLIFVTHDQEEAMTLADRLVVMNDGRIQQVGVPRAIYNDPENLFVAQFIGSPPTNVFDCHADVRGESVMVESDIFAYDYSDHVSQETIGSGDTVSMAVRPENVTLTDSGGDMEGEVTVVEPQGETQAVYLTVDGTEIRSTVHQERVIEPGDRMGLSIDIENSWLFDTTGQRIV
jgi:multiple sugar transport system ATP-binding protein